MSKERAAKDIESAAAIIEQHGWKRGAGASLTNGFCMVDSLSRVVGAGGLARPALKRMAGALDELATTIRPMVHDMKPFYLNLTVVTRYNDHYAPDRDAVLGVMRQTVARLRK